MSWILVLFILQIIQNNWAAPVELVTTAASSALSTEANSLANKWEDVATSTQMTSGATNSLEMRDSLDKLIFGLQKHLEETTQSPPDETTFVTQEEENEVSTNSAILTATKLPNLTGKNATQKELLKDTTYASNTPEFQSQEISSTKAAIALLTVSSSGREEDITTSPSLRENMENQATTFFPRDKHPNINVNEKMEPLPQLKKAVDYFIKDVLKLGNKLGLLPEKSSRLEEEKKVNTYFTTENAITNGLRQTDEKVDMQPHKLITDYVNENYNKNSKGENKLEDTTLINKQTVNPEFINENDTNAINSFLAENEIEITEKHNFDTTTAKVEQYQATKLMQEDSTTMANLKQTTDSFVNQFTVQEDFSTVPMNREQNAATTLKQDDPSRTPALKQTFDSFPNGLSANKDFSAISVSAEQHEATKFTQEDSTTTFTIAANEERDSDTKLVHEDDTTIPAVNLTSDSFINPLLEHKDVNTFAANEEHTAATTLMHEDSTTISAFKPTSDSFANQLPELEDSSMVPANGEHDIAAELKNEYPITAPTVKLPSDSFLSTQLSIPENSATMAAPGDQYLAAKVAHEDSTAMPALKQPVHVDATTIPTLKQPFNSFINHLSSVEESIEKAVDEVVISNSSLAQLKVSNSETQGTTSDNELRQVPAFRQAIDSFIEDVKEIGEKLSLTAESTTDTSTKFSNAGLNQEISAVVGTNFQNNKQASPLTTLKPHPNLIAENLDRTLEYFPTTTTNSLENWQEKISTTLPEVETSNENLKKLPHSGAQTTADYIAEPVTELFTLTAIKTATANGALNEDNIEKVNSAEQIRIEGKSEEMNSTVSKADILNKSSQSVSQEAVDHISEPVTELFTPTTLKTEAAYESPSEKSTQKVHSVKQRVGKAENGNFTISTLATLSKSIQNAAEQTIDNVGKTVVEIFTATAIKSEAANASFSERSSVEKIQSEEQSVSTPVTLLETTTNSFNGNLENVKVMYATSQPISQADFDPEKMQIFEKETETHLQEETLLKTMEAPEKNIATQTEGFATQQPDFGRLMEPTPASSKSSTETEPLVVTATEAYSTEKDAQTSKIFATIMPQQAEQETIALPIAHLTNNENSEKMVDIPETVQKSNLPLSTLTETVVLSTKSNNLAPALENKESQMGSVTQQPDFAHHIDATQLSSQAKNVALDQDEQPDEAMNKVTLTPHQTEQESTTEQEFPHLTTDKNSEKLLETSSTIEITQKNNSMFLTSTESLVLNTEMSTLAPALETTLKSRNFEEELQTDMNAVQETTHLQPVKQTLNAFEQQQSSTQQNPTTTANQNEIFSLLMGEIKTSTRSSDLKELHRSGAIRQDFVDEFADNYNENVNKTTSVAVKELLQLQESSFNFGFSSKDTATTNLTRTPPSYEQPKSTQDEVQNIIAENAIKELSTTASSAHSMGEETTSEMAPVAATEYIAETTTESHIIKEPLQQEHSRFSSNATAQADAVVTTTETTTQNTDRKETQQTSLQLMSTATKTAEPEEEATTLLLPETLLKEMMLTFTESSTEAAEKNQEYRATSETQTPMDVKQKQQQPQIESTTENAAQIESTDANEQPAATTAILDETQTQTEQQTTEAEINSTTLLEEYETTVTPKEPEARSLSSLPPPKLEYTQSDEGVEVFYGYSSVKHN